MKRFIKIIVFVFCSSCGSNNISGDNISNEDIQFLKKLNLLDYNEEIILINTQSGNLIDELKQAGNFFSNNLRSSSSIIPT